MSMERSQPKIEWTAEDRARHKAVREKFRHWHPGAKELAASGETDGSFPGYAYFDFRLAMRDQVGSSMFVWKTIPLYGNGTEAEIFTRMPVCSKS